MPSAIDSAEWGELSKFRVFPKYSRVVLASFGIDNP